MRNLIVGTVIATTNLLYAAATPQNRLCAAIGQGSLVAASQELDAGASIATVCEEWSPGFSWPFKFPALVFAAKLGRQDIVALLVSKGADTCAKDYNSETAVDRAATEGYTDLVLFLLDNAAKVHAPCADPGNALWFAAQNGGVDLAEKLLEKGVPTDSAGPGGSTPLMMTAAYGNLQIAQMLLAHGADPNVQVGGQTPLSMAQGGGRNREAMIALLKGKGGTREDTQTENAKAARKTCARVGYPKSPITVPQGSSEKTIADQILKCYCPESDDKIGAHVDRSPINPGAIEEIPVSAIDTRAASALDENLKRIKFPPVLRADAKITAWRINTKIKSATFVDVSAMTQEDQRPVYSCGFTLIADDITAVLSQRECTPGNSTQDQYAEENHPFDVIWDFNGKPALVVQQNASVGVTGSGQLMFLVRGTRGWEKTTSGCGWGD